MVILGWPDGDGESLAVKIAHFAVDPSGDLPSLPPPIPMGLGDNADAVMAHDAAEAAYYDAYDSSAIARSRMAVRDWRDPLDPSTQRQILIAVVVAGVLLAWRLDSPRTA